MIGIFHGGLLLLLLAQEVEQRPRSTSPYPKQSDLVAGDRINRGNLLPVLKTGSNIMPPCVLRAFAHPQQPIVRDLIRVLPRSRPNSSGPVIVCDFDQPLEP